MRKYFQSTLIFFFWFSDIWNLANSSLASMERTITNLTIFFLSLLPSSSARSLSGCPSLNKQVILLSTSQNSLLHPQDVSSSQQAGASLAHPWCVQLWVLLPVQVRRETTFAPCSTESQVPSRQVWGHCSPAKPSLPQLRRFLRVTHMWMTRLSHSAAAGPGSRERPCAVSSLRPLQHSSYCCSASPDGGVPYTGTESHLDFAFYAFEGNLTNNSALRFSTREAFYIVFYIPSQWGIS